VFRYASASDGVDTFSDFTSASDDYDTDWITAAGNYTFATTATNTAAALNLNTGASGVFEITGVATIDFTDTAAVILAISDGNITVTTGGDDFLLILNDGTNSYLYQVDDGASGDIQAGEISLVGIFSNANLATGDII